MKTERYGTVLCAAVLGFLIAIGSVGCLVSGFELTLDSTPRFYLIVAAVSAATAFGFSLRRGGRWVIGVWLLAAVALIGGTDIVSQCLQLLYRVSYEYHIVYGWPYFTGGQERLFYVSFDHIAVVLAAAISTAVTATVCRRGKAVGALLFSLVPLLPCVVVTHTVPTQGALFCLFTGWVVLLLTNTLRRQDTAGANRLTALVAIPAAAVVFFTLYACSPSEYRNAEDEWRDRVIAWFEGDTSFGKGDGSHGGGVPNGTATKASHKVDLSFVGPRLTDHVGVAELTCSEDGILYLREQHYDLYTGTSWSIDNNSRAYLGDMLGMPEQQTLSVALQRRRDLLWLPYYPQECDSLSWFGQILAGNVEHDAVEYTWQYAPLDEQWLQEALENADLWHANSGTAVPSLPPSTEAWATALADEIVGTQNGSATETARAIAAYVKAHGSYDLNTRAMPDGQSDFAKWFLYESETGYCVHYATAAAVLMRAAGLETHYVTGYACRVQNGKATVYADQAHAWVEYFEPALGIWIPIECTPSDPQTGAPVFAPDAAPTSSGNSVVTTTPATPTTGGATVSTTATPPQSTEKTPSRDVPPTVWGIWIGLGAAALMAVAVWCQRRVRLARRHAAMHRGAPNARALVVWQEIARAARFTGTPPDETVYALAQKARFSQHTLTTDELEAMSAYHRAQIDILCTHGRLKQLLYRCVWVLY